MKTIRETCNENASEFNWIMKICLNFLVFSLNDFILKIRNFFRKKINWGGSGYGMSNSTEEIAIAISKDCLKTTWNF